MHQLVTRAHLLIVAALVSPAGTSAQVPPPDSAGVTWDFETGDLRGWTPTGDAFTFQPTLGDNVRVRSQGSADQQGLFWIGTYERYTRNPDLLPGQTRGDTATGTLTSNPFRIPAGSLSFLIGGSSGPETRVDLLAVDPRTGNQEQVRVAHGDGQEEMRRETWDLSGLAGQIGRIRIVDESRTGHINVDDFLFTPPPPGVVSAGVTQGVSQGAAGGAVPTTPAVVPNLVGRDVRVAEEMLISLGLTLLPQESVPSTEPRGTVLEQTPEPGTEVPRGDTVAVTLAAWVAVPDLLDRDTTAAGRALTRLGLKVGRVTSQLSARPRGAVIEQQPPAGTEVPLGSSVNLVASEWAQVPDLLGRDTAEARALLAARGLYPGVHQPQLSEEAMGTVLAQSPAPDALLPMRSSVDMTVAAGVAVPDLAGLDSLAARANLDAAGLRLSDTSSEPSPEPTGTVIRQEPPAGEKVPLATPVSIVLAEAVPVPDLDSADLDQVRERLGTAGLTLGEVSREPSAKPMATVIGQSPEAGAMVPLRSPVDVVMARGMGVPRLRGISLSSARKRLADSLLAEGPFTQRPSTEPPGTVLEQDPEAGTVLPVGTAVSLEIAQGVPVPDLMGMDTLGAQAVLDSASLTLGQVERRPAPAASWTVIEQSPASRDVVALQTPVNVVIAEPVPVPDVVDTLGTAAADILTDAGLTPGETRRKWSLARTGVVLTQDPPSGTPVPLETSVSIVVARHFPLGWIAIGIVLIGVVFVLVRWARAEEKSPRRRRRQLWEGESGGEV